MDKRLIGRGYIEIYQAKRSEYYDAIFHITRHNSFDEMSMSSNGNIKNTFTSGSSSSHTNIIGNKQSTPIGSPVTSSYLLSPPPSQQHPSFIGTVQASPV